MDLTVAQAADLLQVTPRVIRHMITTKRLSAHRKGRRWVIRKRDLPLTEAQRERAQKMWAETRAIVDESLPANGPPKPGEPTEENSPYTVRNLPAFQAAVQACLRLDGAGCPSSSPVHGQALAPGARLLEGLRVLAVAYHDFDRVLKRSGFREARKLFTLALAELAVLESAHQAGGETSGEGEGVPEASGSEVAPNPGQPGDASAGSAFLEAIDLLEQEVLPGMGGQLKRIESPAGAGKSNSGRTNSGRTSSGGTRRRGGRR